MTEKSFLKKCRDRSKDRGNRNDNNSLYVPPTYGTSLGQRGTSLPLLLPTDS